MKMPRHTWRGFYMCEQASSSGKVQGETLPHGNVEAHIEGVPRGRNSSE